MLAFLTSLLIAVLLGFLAAMGVGGGSLLLLWLTQVVLMPQEQARILNLLFYLPAALVSTLFHRKNQQFRKDTVLPALTAGCTAALCFTILGQYWDINILKKGLGGLLILIGLREIFYRPRKAK